MDEKTIKGTVYRVAAQWIPEFAGEEWRIDTYKYRRGIIAIVETPNTQKYIGGYQFMLDIPKRLSFNGHLFLNCRGIGLGRRMVNFRESLCASLGIEDIIINANAAPKFWGHMGYEKLSKEEISRLGRENIWFPIEGIDPVHKQISREMTIRKRPGQKMRQEIFYRRIA